MPRQRCIRDVPRRGEGRRRFVSDVQGVLAELDGRAGAHVIVQRSGVVATHDGQPSAVDFPPLYLLVNAGAFATHHGSTLHDSLIRSLVDRYIMDRTVTYIYQHHCRSSRFYLFLTRIRLTTSQLGVRDPSLISRESIYYCEIQNQHLFAHPFMLHIRPMC
jgi:hypothetical protein